MAIQVLNANFNTNAEPDAVLKELKSLGNEFDNQGISIKVDAESIYDDGDVIVSIEHTEKGTGQPEDLLAAHNQIEQCLLEI